VTTTSRHLEALEFERKFLLPESTLDVAVRGLRALVRADDRHPQSIVSSIYYDTPSFRLLNEKTDGQLYKTKVRLRWYEEPGAGTTEASSFLEVKSRIGTRRSKWRRAIDLPAGYLAGARLTDPVIGRVPLLLEEDPTVALRGLVPVLVVRYRRHRFVDPLSDDRISIDDRITVPRTNPRLLGGSAHVRPRQVVLEVKSSTGRSHLRLGFLKHLGARAAAFSKYHAAVALLT
jgi:hypothetical protein